VRLRDPVPPDRDGSFARNTGAVPPRVVALAGAAVLLVLVVLLVLLLA
jgi:hypothetical protein